MADHLTPVQRSRAMKRVKLQNGSLENIVQEALRSRGLRFRRHLRTLPGSPDITFSREKVAVFVDGDFWHGWRLPIWEHKLKPFWRNKLRVNRARDARNFRRLRSKGWQVLRIWQHQLETDSEGAIAKIFAALRVPYPGTAEYCMGSKRQVSRNEPFKPKKRGRLSKSKSR